MPVNLRGRGAALLSWLLGAAAAVVGLAGLGAAWMALFWVPSVALALVPVSRLLRRPELPRVSRGTDGRWRLLGGGGAQAREFAVDGRRYVTSAAVAARLVDGATGMKVFATGAALDAEQFRRLRMALRHPAEK